MQYFIKTLDEDFRSLQNTGLTGLWVKMFEYLRACSSM